MKSSKINLIALCGLAGSGKSTLANILIEEHDFHRVKFAGPLKSMLITLGLTHEHVEGKLKEVPCDLLGGKTPRYAMQTLGTEWGRDLITPSLWTKAWKQKVQDYLDRGFKVVVDDCRFPNELRAVNELGGISIMIERPGIASVESHISEQHALETDVVLVNDGTIGQLHLKLDSLL
jgi:energy-coupling factor transporter ATP-binding protein EcfA2